MKNENTWDSEGTYFNAGGYAEADVEQIKQLVLPGMESFEHTLGRLVLSGEMSAIDAYNELRDKE